VKQELPMAPFFLTDRNEMSNVYRGSSKFQFIRQSGLRADDVLEINQSETRIVCGGHVC
jgi:hypothetical protein